MRALLDDARAYADLRDPIVLAGPTGTGKSTLARWIHAHSRRAHGPFVSVNCAALPGPLFASEVFGHVQGAFTGATRGALGLARAADHGTLFLDEIGELAPDDQRKLLTFLDSGSVRPVGSPTAHRVDVRVVVASHRDLEAAPDVHRDLWYRLEALRLTVPFLIQRPDDLPALARHLLAEAAERNDLPCPRLTHDAVAVLLTRAWPGNLRELHNVLLRALLAAHREDSPRIEPRHLGAHRPATRWDQLRDAFQGAVVRQTLQEVGDNRRAAAERLGMSESRLYDVLKREG